MKMKSAQRFVVAGLLGGAVSAGAATLEICNATKVAPGAGDVLRAASVTESAFPVDLGVTPSFWLDASDTAAWTVTDGLVSRVPSKVTGSTRYLKTAQEAGDTWTVWQVEKPALAEESSLGGKTVLDFGAIGSGRGLVFNAASVGGGTASNSLESIGTVCAVYDSSQSGGFFLSGGYLAGHARSGYLWTRGLDTVKAGANGNYYYSNPAFQYLGSTVMRQDGYATDGSKTGFSGGWQVLSYVASGSNRYPATGIGFDDGRYYKTTRSGGMKIAEMIFFEEVLTDAQLARVEAYLTGKWFARATRGQNGESGISLARLSAPSNAQVTAEAAAGERLSIDRLRGGYSTATETKPDGSALLKTGAGTLVLSDAANYGALVRLSAGALELSGRVIPSSSELPPLTYLHFDATDLTPGALSEWANSTETCYMNARIEGFVAGASAPTVVTDSLLGESVVDFGGAGSLARPMTIKTSAKSGVKLTGVTTFIGVIRGNGAADPSGSGLVTYADGVRLARTTGFFKRGGWQVLAWQTSGADFTGLGGGYAIAELFVYDHILREDEIKDVSAYLADKWLSRTLSGYQKASRQKAVDLQRVEICGTSTLDIPTDVRRVGTLALNAALTKTGSGTLEVLSDVPDADQHLTIRNGAVVRGAAPDPETFAEVASGAALHLDASDARQFQTFVDGGETRIRSWADPISGNAAKMYANDAYCPYLNTTDTLNGKSVVDFGSLGLSNGGRYMIFDQAVDSIKSAYVVWNTENGGGCILGNVVADDMYSSNGSDSEPATQAFRRGAPSTGGVIGDASCPFFFINSAAARAQTCTNGVVVADSTTEVPTRGWMLVEIHAAVGDELQAGGLASNYAGINARSGGQRLAEVVLYDRALSEREKIATRNYLMKKWFAKTDAELDPLPEAPSATPVVARAYDVDEEAVCAVGAGQGVSARQLTGSGSFSKTGAGTLTLGDLSAYDGEVQLTGGTLAITDQPISAGAALVEDGLILRLDATQGLTLDGTNVTSWASALGDGWVAVPGSVGTDTWYPTVRENDLKGNRTVDMAAGSFTRAQFFRFKKDGEYAQLSGIKTVFWVLGSQNKGGYLMGGGSNNYGSFFRGDFSSGTASLLGQSQADPAVWKASWQVDGTNVLSSSTGVLNGDWNVVSMVITNASASTAVDGLAYDKRILNASPSMVDRAGSQRLGEVLVYNRALTTQEIVKVTGYLRGKWMPGYQRSSVNAARVTVSEGARLDCGGSVQTVESLRGTVAVANGSVSARELTLDCASPEVVTVYGTFALPENLTIRLQNVATAGDLVGRKIPVLSAMTFEGAERIRQVSFVGDSIPEGVRARAKFENGKLIVSFVNAGFVMIFW